MIDTSKKYQVLIVGGGPVGLFLGLCLTEAGISCKILEKREKPVTFSRSVGLHPVALELFQELEIARCFVENGLKVYNGHAFTNTRKIGTISFAECPPPFNYILTLPQSQTERLLVQELVRRNEEVLCRNVKFLDVTDRKDGLNIRCCQSGDKELKLKADFLIGCDGKNSSVRSAAGISFKGYSYPDTYVMGDFTDNTELGSDAAVFLAEEGLIESFPLPRKQRRWVVKTDALIQNPERRQMEKLIRQRIGHDLTGTDSFMLSSFGVHKYMAVPMTKNRIALCGDAAHVVSPIGGQGMNLGWLDAWKLSKTLQHIFENTPLDAEQIYNQMERYSRKRTTVARKVMRRAELNMHLGRRARLPAFRNALVWTLLNSPAKKIMSRLFTMRGLERWPV